MKILNRLTLRYFKDNIFRTVLTIFGLVISISMIVFILTSFVGLNRSLFDETIRKNGFQDFTIYNTDEEVLKKLFLTKNISKLTKTDDSKVLLKYYGNLNGNEALSSLTLKDVREDYFKDFFKYELVEGRLPREAGEILVPYGLKEALRDYGSLGEIIDASTVSRSDFETYKESFDIYSKDFSISKVNDIREIRKIGFERFIGKNYKSNSDDYQDVKLKIVGYYSITSFSYAKPYSEILKNRSGGQINFFEGTLIRLVDDVENVFNIEGVFSGYDNIDNTITSINELIGDSSDKSSLVLNDDIIPLKYPRLSNSLAYVILSSIIVSIILLSILIFIYNIFSTNYSEKSRDIGLLRVVGLTNRQLRKTILLESLYYLLISLPLGYFIGIILVRGVFSRIQRIYNESISGLFFKFSYENSYLVLIVTIVLSTYLILLTQYLASSKLLRMTPMKSINNFFNNDRPREIKGYKLILKNILSRDEFFALRSATYQRRRFILTTVSLTLSIVIFVLASFITKTFDIQVNKAIKKDQFSYGILLSNNRKKTQDFVKDTEEINGIEANHTSSYCEVSLYDDKGEISNRSNVLIVMADKYFDDLFPQYKLIDRLALVTNQINDGTISYNSISILPRSERLYKYNEISAITKERIKNSDFSLQMISSNIPEIMTYMKESEYYDNVLLTRESSFNEIYSKDFELTDVIELSKFINRPMMDDKIEALLIKYPLITVDSYDLPIVKLIKLYSNSVVAVIMMIAILNVLNSTYNNIMIKRRDIALLKVVGIEDSRMGQIVVDESVISVLIASVVSFIISAIVILYFYSVQKNEMGGNLVPIYYPLIIYLSSVIGSYLLVSIVSFIQYRFMDKNNLASELKII